MLAELAVANLGVIADLRLVLEEGLTALTGETGAGKTMVVEAVELLMGGKADPMLVRPGTDEASVEGRFALADDEEVVLARIIPAVGRSRAYVNGRIAPVSALGEWGARLVDLHGQHAHQSLLAAATQRAALDRFGAVDLGPLREARRELASIDAARAELGGDERARAREIDLLRFQVDELEAAAVRGPDEDDRLAAQQDLLSDAQAHRVASSFAVGALSDERGASDGIGAAIAAVAGRGPFAALETRLRALSSEVTDIATELRGVGESIDDDPRRLEEITERRQLLHDLSRKYGDTLAEVLSYAEEARARLLELETRGERAAALDRRHVAALDAATRAAAVVGTARRAAAPGLAAAVQARLAGLAMAKATVVVEVGTADPGDDVAFLLSANPGAPPLPLAKVASGGELARAMLALRLVLSGAAGDDDTAPPTLVFDEVDAGIGGAAATAVGRALSLLASGRQVFVVTHLPQVAAFADHQIVVAKDDDGRTTRASAAPVDGDDRVVELSRMLSGSPASATAREHAAELLAEARTTRP
ncbi:MAG: DNA repair protein RecN [Acidimicrobiales bacterium]